MHTELEAGAYTITAESLSPPLHASRGFSIARSRMPAMRRDARAVTATFVGALALHGLVLAPLVLGLGGKPWHRVPNREGAGARTAKGLSVTEATLVMISVPATQLAADSSQDLASAGISPELAQIRIISPDARLAPSLVRFSDDPSAPMEDQGDQAQRAQLFGRYMGQIKARIERAWLRPRSAIGAPRFACRTTIEQDKRGNVTNVSLPSCNGSERWQSSLIAAIRAASPLPMPPDSGLSADRVTLSFDAEAYTPASGGYGYEPADTLVAVASPGL